jgi:hypothetical protein
MSREQDRNQRETERRHRGIFWVKTQARWRETSQLEISRVGEFDRLSDEELLDLLRREAQELGILESEPPMQLTDGLHVVASCRS